MAFTRLSIIMFVMVGLVIMAFVNLMKDRSSYKRADLAEAIYQDLQVKKISSKAFYSLFQDHEDMSYAAALKACQGYITEDCKTAFITRLTDQNKLSCLKDIKNTIDETQGSKRDILGFNLEDFAVHAMRPSFEAAMERVKAKEKMANI